MERLCDILSSVKENFTLESNAEITVEVNPDSGKKLDFALMKNTGFNRLSIGMQSAVPAELKKLGRIHTAEDAKHTAELAQAVGITNISLDLMTGIPLQTKETLKQSVDFCAQCGVTHISSYILKIEENTKFAQIESKLNLPSDDEQAELYLYTVELLEQYGYMQYEISNFAKKGFESRHNLGYWSHIPYLGVGLNASSYLDEKRFENPSDMKDYLEIQSFGDAYEGARSLSVYEQMEEFMFLGLRNTKDISKKAFIERFGCSMDSVYGKPLIESMKQGMMKEEGDRVFLTQDGTLVSNQVLCEFLFDEEV